MVAGTPIRRSVERYEASKFHDSLCTYAPGPRLIRFGNTRTLLLAVLSDSTNVVEVPMLATKPAWWESGNDGDLLTSSSTSNYIRQALQILGLGACSLERATA